jgi:hypothetical protein
MQMPQPLPIQTTLADLLLFNSLPDVELVPMWMQAPRLRTKHSPVPARSRMTSCIAKSLELIQSVMFRVTFLHIALCFPCCANLTVV